MPKQILIVDDSATIQKVIRIAFAKYDAEIMAATSYPEAAAVIGTRAPNVILADAGMFGDKASEEITKLRNAASGCPVMILVGTYDAIDRAKLQEAGFKHFLNKPFDSADMVRLTNDLLGGNLSLRESENGEMAGEGSGTGAHFVPPPPPTNPGTVSANFQTQVQSQPPTSTPPGAHADFGAGVFEAADQVLTDAASVGQRAFANEADTKVSASRSTGFSQPPQQTMEFSLPESSRTVQSPVQGGMGSRDHIQPSELFGAMPEDVSRLVKETISRYCEENLEKIAREVITEEIRRLTEERARHLIDA